MIDRRYLWKAEWDGLLRLAKSMGLELPQRKNAKTKLELIERMTREMVRLEMMDAFQRRLR